jgi:hypothetical protein
MRLNRKTDDKPKNSNRPSLWRRLVTSVLLNCFIFVLEYLFKLAVIALLTYCGVLVQSL